MLDSLSGKFLIIDDDESLRNLLEVIISSAGADSLCAAKPSEAIELLTSRTEEIEAILLDLNLEGSNGENLYDELVAIKPELLIFPMSGCYDEEIKERLAGRRIDGLITKPFLSAGLIKILSDGIAKRNNLDLSSQRI